MDRGRSGLAWTRLVMSWALLVLAVLVLGVTVLVPRALGATPYSVLTGSMSPSLPPGTLVVVKPRPAESIGVGTVITYQRDSGSTTVVTHRVVAKSVSPTGDVLLRTRGDANGVPDAAWVREVQVRGALVYAVPYLGRANSVLDGHQRQLLVYAVAVVLMGYAASMFGAALAGRRRRLERV